VEEEEKKERKKERKNFVAFRHPKKLAIIIIIKIQTGKQNTSTAKESTS